MEDVHCCVSGQKSPRDKAYSSKLLGQSLLAFDAWTRILLHMLASTSLSGIFNTSEFVWIGLDSQPPYAYFYTPVYGEQKLITQQSVDCTILNVHPSCMWWSAAVVISCVLQYC